MLHTRQAKRWFALTAVAMAVPLVAQKSSATHPFAAK